MKFYLYLNSQTNGPYSEESIQEYLRSGRASPNDWAWKEGEKEWVRLSDLIETAKHQEQSCTETDDMNDQKFDEYTKKIKRLASSEEVNLAIDFVRLINSPGLYEELLKDCSIDKEGNVFLVGWWEEKNRELLPFFLELVAHCPEEASINSSLKRESITSLRCDDYCWSLTNVDVLSNLTNLTELRLNGCSSLTNVD